MRVGLSHQLGYGLRLIAFRLKLGSNMQGHSALALLGTWRSVRREGCSLAGDQRMLLHQGLWRLPEAGRMAVGADGQTGRFTRDGARLGARAESLRYTVGHDPNMAAERGLG